MLEDDGAAEVTSRMRDVCRTQSGPEPRHVTKCLQHRERKSRKTLTSNSFLLFKVLLWKEMFSHTYVAVTSRARLAPEATLGVFWAGANHAC